MKEFAFDVALQAVVRVRAKTKREAQDRMSTSMQSMNVGREIWPGLTITEASLHGTPELFAVKYENGQETAVFGGISLLDILENMEGHPDYLSNFKLYTVTDLADFVEGFATADSGVNLARQEALLIAEVALGKTSRDEADLPVGQLGCLVDGTHDFATFYCPKCARTLCWTCGVNCTNDSKGEGFVECPCGYHKVFYRKIY